MRPRRFDVLVVGAGPAGSIAALVLARAGAGVALLDKGDFPRDKACGDFVGPRGLQVLADLGLPVPPGLDVGDLAVVGPTGRRVVLPCFDGVTYPGRARAVTRAVFDDALRAAALDAGAVAFAGRADRPVGSGGGIDGFESATGWSCTPTSPSAPTVQPATWPSAPAWSSESRVLWGFAVRLYLEQQVRLPTITLWDETRWRTFPGYGWIFPGPDGVANVGVGIGTLADRQAGAGAVRVLPSFLDHLVDLGLLDRAPDPPLPRRLGGWLKMGMVGTTPAAGRVLLVGDAAGLVNPLQGEGIAQAMTSGRSAAEAVLCSPGQAAARYRAELARAHLPYQRITAAGHAALVGHPLAVAAVGRVLTSPVLGRRARRRSGIFWSELLDGAAPGGARSVASATTWFGRAVTARTDVSRWFSTTFDNHGAPGPWETTERGSTWSDQTSG